MKKRNSGSSRGAMLDLWQPPEGAGDPVGCVATTYTFHPGLFDEQCLARFLEIESEPDREDLAFLLEWESSAVCMRASWSTTHRPAWSIHYGGTCCRCAFGPGSSTPKSACCHGHGVCDHCVGEFEEPGYRTNFEVAAAVDLPDDADLSMLGDA